MVCRFSDTGSSAKEDLVFPARSAGAGNSMLDGFWWLGIAQSSTTSTPGFSSARRAQVLTADLCSALYKVSTFDSCNDSRYGGIVICITYKDWGVSEV